MKPFKSQCQSLAMLNKFIAVTICILSQFLVTQLSYASRVEISASSEFRDPYRAIHFVLRAVSLESGRRIIDKAKADGFNTVIVTLTDGVRLDTAPWKPRQDAWSKADFVLWWKYAKSHGLEVIPELKLLTHQEKYLQGNFPELMYNSSTYDPRSPNIYRLVVFPLIDELITLMSPRNIHIGHDEVAGFVPWKKGVNTVVTGTMLPADFFLQDVVVVNDYLNKKGVKAWIWGDMLVSPLEFPGMKRDYLNGTPVGYGKSLRTKLPRNITICDWHYSGNQASFPSTSTMIAEGFEVLGATWKNNKTTRNFAEFAARVGARGMISTTWFHVQRKEWDIVDRIMRDSGKIFFESFPDTK